MKKSIKYHILLLLLLLPIAAMGMEYPNRYNGMAESLFDMMDAFSSAYQRRLNEPQTPSTPPYYFAQPPLYPGGNSALFQGTPQSPARGTLDGGWQGQSGERLVIKQNQFRIYRDRYNFRQGLIRIMSPKHLIMQDNKTGQGKPYEYVYSKGRLALRDADNNLLLYRRLSW